MLNNKTKRLVTMEATAEDEAELAKAAPLLPQQRLQQFQAELQLLMQRYGVVIEPKIRVQCDMAQAVAIADVQFRLMGD